MPRGTKSQWEFGELFPVEQTRKVWTVAELTGRIRQLLEAQIGEVWVAGEISNLRLQASGHCYFTLKDAASQLACVLFRREGAAPRDVLQDGVKVVLRGDLSVYEPRGQYQLIVRQVELQGVTLAVDRPEVRPRTIGGVLRARPGEVEPPGEREGVGAGARRLHILSARRHLDGGLLHE